MAYVHSLVAFRRGGLDGIQSCQRDWSPYLVHFTTYRAMASVRRLAGTKPFEAAKKLATCDGQSWTTAKAIVESGKICAGRPAERSEIPCCVCLSECNLPGLLSHSERYGRFGFVLKKRHVYSMGGRPCLYVGRDEYAELAKRGRGKTASDSDGRLYGLANVFTPPGNGHKVQDFTHEREWRVFASIDLKPPAWAAVIAPDRHCADLRGLVAPSVHVIPIDTLFEWGA